MPSCFSIIIILSGFGEVVTLAQNKKQNYLQGAVVLTISVIVMKIFGGIYKIPLANILGKEGNAYFTMAYTIFTVLQNLSTAGLPVAVSRLISEASELNRPNQVRRIFRVAVTAFGVIGTVGSLIMMIFPAELADSMGNVKSAQSILALAPSVALVCVLSAYRGYIQGHSNMTPTSVSQAIEVIVKVIFGLALALLAARAGMSVPMLSAAAVSGVPIGSAAALAYIIYKKRQFDRETLKPLASPDVPETVPKVLKRLLSICIPISLGASILSVISLIDLQLTMHRLQTAVGFTESHATELYGVYGMILTLYNLPAAVITSLTVSIVPAIAAALARRSIPEAREITESSLRISTILALPMGIGLSVLAYPVCYVIYYRSMSVEGPYLLAVLGIASYFVCMSLMTNAILQASGRERLPVYSMIVGGLVKIALNWFLVARPELNIVGAPIGTLVCYIVMFAMNWHYVSKTMQGGLSLAKIMLRPAVSGITMGAAAWAVYSIAARLLTQGGVLGHMRMAIAMCAGIGAGVVVYLVMIILMRAITAEDLSLMPKGDRLAKLLRIK